MSVLLTAVHGWLVAWLLHDVMLDREGFAALVRLDTWREYLTGGMGLRGLRWTPRETRFPRGYTAHTFLAPEAPGYDPTFYEGDGCDLDAPRRYMRSVRLIAKAEGRADEEVIVDALLLQHADLVAAVVVADAPPPANDDAPPASPATAPEVAPTPMRETPDPALDEFLRLHPAIFEVMERLAREALGAGAGRISVNALFESLRADIDTYREACGDELPPPAANNHRTWRLNNTLRAPLARLFAARCPDLADKIDMRRAKSDRDPRVQAAMKRAAERAGRRAS